MDSELRSELQDGRRFTLTPGMSQQVGNAPICCVHSDKQSRREQYEGGVAHARDKPSLALIFSYFQSACMSAGTQSGSMRGDIDVTCARLAARWFRCCLESGW